MRRVSIGTVELTTVACTPDRDRAAGKLVAPPPVGFTVGNNSEGLTGETLVPGIGGSETSGGTALDDAGSDAALLAAATTSVADAEEDSEPLAEACAVKATGVPSGAAVDTGTETSSS